jgi:thiamine-monophosphate kinase
LRKGLKEGDLLAYTGNLGESKKGLERLFKGETIEASARFFEPTLRQIFIANARPYLRVGMDISDGLFCDTNKLLEYNSLGMESLHPIEEEIGASGEEYEMLIGFDKKHLESLKRVAEETDTPLTIFAKVVQNRFRFACRSHHF